MPDRRLAGLLGAVVFEVEQGGIRRPMVPPAAGVHDGLPTWLARTVSSRAPRLSRSEGCLPMYALCRVAANGCPVQIRAAASGRRIQGLGCRLRVESGR